MIKKISSFSIFFLTTILFFSNSGCSLYKSQGRKSFETKAEQNIPSISLKSCQTSEQLATQKQLSQNPESIDNLTAVENLSAINIFGIQLYKSFSASDSSTIWTIKDLRNNSCIFQSGHGLSPENERAFLETFHHLTDLNRAPDLDQSLFY